jgi:ABC-type lipoprotein export system ATPase subunit
MISPVVQAVAAGRLYRRNKTSFPALASASCQIFPGDRIAIVGPSGSGKSTLLHLIGGLDRPTSGVLNWPALGPNWSLRPGRIALVFQAPSLLPTLNVQENVELPLLLGRSREDAGRKAAAALDLFGLGDLVDKLPQELSGGQAQRIAMVRAVVSDPKLLLADEPTGQLDHATARRLLDVLLAHFAGTETAIVVSTHDPSVAKRMEKVWQMRRGVLETTSPAGRTL